MHAQLEPCWTSIHIVSAFLWEEICCWAINCLALTFLFLPNFKLCYYHGTVYTCQSLGVEVRGQLWGVSFFLLCRSQRVNPGCQHGQQVSLSTEASCQTLQFFLFLTEVRNEKLLQLCFWERWKERTLICILFTYFDLETFCFLFCFFEEGFLCVALAVLALAL